MPDAPPVTFAPAIPYPEQLVVDCPACAQPHQADMAQDAAGVWRPDVAERFVICSACGAGIEILGLRCEGQGG